jgi:CHAT domain-containing protein
MFPKCRERTKSLTRPFLKLQRIGRSWVRYSLLALFTTLSCTVASPIFAQVPVVAPIVQRQLNPEQLVQQGKTFYEAGQFADAAMIWQKAAEVYRSQRDNLNQALSLNYLCLAYQQLGKWQDAEPAITQSLELLTNNKQPTTNNQHILAQALNTQGSLQLAQGQAEKALASWKQATAIYEQVGDEVGSIGSQINQAQALQTLGLYRQAKNTLIQIEQTLQNKPDSPIKITALRSLGNALRVVGDLDESRKLLQQSLTIAQQLKSSLDISAALVSLGNTAHAQADTEAALEFYQQATTASTSPITRTQAQLNQLSVLLATNQVSAAQTLVSQLQAQMANLPLSRAAVYAQINFAQRLTQLRQTNTTNTPSPTEISKILARAIQQAKSLNDTRAEAHALGHLGELYEQTQQLSNAQNLTEKALLIAQSVNASDIAYRWQWQLGRLFKAQGKTKEAIASYTEAVNTLQSLRSDLVTINPDIQFSFREEVEPIYRQLVDLLLQPLPSQEGIEQEPSQENLVKARAVIESLQLAELDNFFRVACLQGKPVLVDQVIDRDDPTAAVIYPIILPDRIEVILKLPNLPLRHYKANVTQDNVERLLDSLRGRITTPIANRQEQVLSKQVYDWLIRPAEDALTQSQIKTLVFVLDGSLRNIPMAALYDGQQYLVQKYSVALAPGLQLLSPKPLERTQLKTLTAGLSEARHGFSALIHVPEEVQQIKSEVSSRVLLNQEFTSTTLQNAIQSVPFPVVHLATHGQFSSNAEDTFILTWDGRLNVKELDNLLRVRDQSQPNAIELLVLSACQTAKGDKRAALGLAGVALRAGARSTIASLWAVDDESTSILMTQFYRELARTTLSKAESLRQAQLSLLENPRYKRPHYWAAFVLVGNWL